MSHSSFHSSAFADFVFKALLLTKYPYEKEGLEAGVGIQIASLYQPVGLEIVHLQDLEQVLQNQKAYHLV